MTILEEGLYKPSSSAVTGNRIDPKYLACSSFAPGPKQFQGNKDGAGGGVAFSRLPIQQSLGVHFLSDYEYIYIYIYRYVYCFKLSHVAPFLSK